MQLFSEIFFLKINAKMFGGMELILYLCGVLIKERARELGEYTPSCVLFFYIGL